MSFCEAIEASRTTGRGAWYIILYATSRPREGGHRFRVSFSSTFTLLFAYNSRFIGTVIWNYTHHVVAHRRRLDVYELLPLCCAEASYPNDLAIWRSFLSSLLEH